MMMRTPAERLKMKAKLFRGFADPTRLSILECLRDGARTVGAIAAETGQGRSNVSNHLACLLGCGLVKNSRLGKNIRYSLRNARVRSLLVQGDTVLSEVYREIFECTRSP